MSDIAAFIRARLDEDERIARAAAVFIDANGEDDEDPGDAWEASGIHVGTAIGSYHIATAEDTMHAQGPELAQHIARHDPARILRQVERDRRILARAQAVAEMDEDSFEEHDGWRRKRDPVAEPNLGVLILRDLAAAWSTHPDFDPAWSAVDSKGGKP